MEETIFLRFIANVLNVRTCCIHPADRDHVLAAFEKECCFHAALQPMYTKDSLEYLLLNTQPETFYEITDFVNTCLILFQFEGVHYLIGPYVKSSFSDKEMQTLLATHKLTNGIFLPLKLYYSQFSPLSYAIVSNTILAAMRAFYPSTPDHAYRKLHGFHEELKKEEFITRSSETYLQILQRYEMENLFLRKISEGDVAGVESSFENVAYSFYSAADSAQQSIYTTNYTGFATLRTLARKAAEQGGCPVVKIDEITQESIQRTKYD